MKEKTTHQTLKYTSVIKESESKKALLVEIDNVEYWIPKSVVEVDELKKEITAPVWLLKKLNDSGAIFSDCGTRRFVLWRQWNERGKTALCIGLNPSKASAQKNDPTIDRLVSQLSRLGYGGLRMCNLFTHISSDPAALLDESVRQNETGDLGIIFGNALSAQEIFFCWGSFKEAEGRAKKVIDFFPDAKCFGKNLDGSPWHPQACMYAGWNLKKTSRIHQFLFREHVFDNNVYYKKDKRVKDPARQYNIDLNPK